MPIYIAYAADILMILASGGAAIYCLILSRRLSRLTSFDKGIGGAIAVLSAQVDEMKAALADAKAGSDGAGQQLHDLVGQARDISGELELMIAACHDFAEEALVVQGGDPHEHDLRADRHEGKTRSRGEEAMALPVFGTRRSPPPEPIFRHGGLVGGQ